MNNNVAESTIQLLDASELDNVDQVKDLLAQGADLNAQNEAGVTALMVAAGYGGEKVAKHLLSLPTIDTEVREEELGWTALLWAAGQGQLRLVKMLLQHGADPGAVSNLGVTALMLAAANGREDVADYLLCLPTIDTEVRDEEGCTALLWAAGVGQLRLVMMLLQHGANPGAVSNLGVTALMAAAKNGREEVAGYLLSLPSTDMEAKCEYEATALLYAARGGHLHIFQLLLHSGANIEAVDHEGNNVLTWAAMNFKYMRQHKRQVIQYLVEEAGFPVADRALEEVATTIGIV